MRGCSKLAVLRVRSPTIIGNINGRQATREGYQRGSLTRLSFCMGNHPQSQGRGQDENVSSNQIRISSRSYLMGVHWTRLLHIHRLNFGGSDMNKYEGVTLTSTNHGHQTYCARAGPADKDELTQLCQAQLHNGDYDYDHHDFIHLSGVWWVYEHQDDTVTFITCYGRSNIDMPKALRWAKHHDDRIVLGMQI